MLLAAFLSLLFVSGALCNPRNRRLYKVRAGEGHLSDGEYDRFVIGAPRAFLNQQVAAVEDPSGKYVGVLEADKSAVQVNVQGSNVIGVEVVGVEQEEPDVPTPKFDCFLRPDGNYAAGICETRFWQCANGKAYVVPCHDKELRYNAEINACVRQSAVPGCRHNSMMLPPTVSPCKNQPAGFYPDPFGNCQRFMFCVSGEEYSLNCPDGEVYDDGMGHCSPEEQVSGPCGRGIIRPFDCLERDDGYYRSTMDCGVYYKCEDHKVRAMTCPLFQAFSFQKLACVPYYEIKGCGPPQDATRQEQFCALQRRDDVYADPDNCHRSIVCSLGKAFVFVCAEEGAKAYDPVLGKCVKEYGECKSQ